MVVSWLKSFPPNSNPFNHDLCNMGITVGKNCVVMMKNHVNEECKFLIVVNTVTGERVKITLGDA